MSFFESLWGGTNGKGDSRNGNGMSFCLGNNTLRYDDHDQQVLSSNASLNGSPEQVEENVNEDEEHGQITEAEQQQIEEGDEESDSDSVEVIDPFSAMVVGAVCCWYNPIPIQSFKDFVYRTIYWTGLNKDQILGGLVVAFGQVPEVTSYAILAGVSPNHALQTTWIMGVITAIVGGRPGMISGATASTAIASINLVRSYGVEFLSYAVMLAGLMQIAFGFLQLGRLLRFVPHSAMVGFANAASIIIIFAQLKFLKIPGQGINAQAGEPRAIQIGHHSNYYSVLFSYTPWINLETLTVMLIEAALTLFICILFPKITKIIPGTFVALTFVTILEWSVARQVGFPGLLVQDYQSLETPSISRLIFMDSTTTVPPISFDTFKKVWPTAIALFAVSTVETLLTSRVVGDKTEIKGSENLMTAAQGLAQFVSALLGGIGGGAQIGQSIVNYKSGGTTCLSSFFAGAILFVLLAGAYPAVGCVPLGAIIGLMLYAVYNLVQWKTCLTILSAIFPQKMRDILFLDCKVSRVDALIMLAVMAVGVFFDLAIALFVGTTISVYAFSWDCSNRIEVERSLPEGEDSVIYRIKGPLFTSTSHTLLNLFTKETISKDPNDVILYLQDAEIHDWSGQIALKKLYNRIEAMGKTVALSSLSATSKRLMEKNSTLWYGVVFLEVEEIDEGDLDSMQKGAGEEDVQDGAEQGEAVTAEDAEDDEIRSTH